MRLHKNLVSAIANSSREILISGRYADKAIEFILKHNSQWGSRDRRFVAEGIYDIVRNYRLFSTLAQSDTNFWFITGVWLCTKEMEIPAWPEFTHLNRADVLARKERLRNHPAIYESYPDWLWQLAEGELGTEKWTQEAMAMNKQAEVFLRTNMLKTNRAQLMQMFGKLNIATEEVHGLAETIKLTKRENIFKSALFKEGYFEVQDKGSQQISRFLNPQPGQTIVDACAGGGGKTLHLAALMQNKGRIISLDVEEWKLEELKKRARRAGVHNVETRLIENTKTIKNLEAKADRLLLDVPCSGLGVIKRNPDAKWKLSADSIAETKQKQEDIIQRYSAMLKTGGEMVYSTCSILPSENQLQVQKFMAQNSRFSILEEKTILPSEGGDGFYMARILKHEQ